ncbi:tRNA (guanine(10)-N2)-methyltransferase homolog isoform X2 [Maniola hyperantus]|uniref:tRNA (guanine(10)-N2)-methyltransferase homolog isoform X2 n=1 Tax=Aphantopus hyperantus TaxID=2795564 RepID=UPI001567EC7F|nr:tRNA (guanine(10)-N2)-methyltransferase homolog [Maniola hyperantus]
MWRRYLMWFAHEHVDFRYAEIQSILSLFDMPIKYIEKPCISKPYWVVELPSEECVKKIASRSVLIKNCIELWARAKTEARLHENLKSSINNDTGSWICTDTSNDRSDLHICPSELLEACSDGDKSFKIEVETFCKHFTMREKVEKIEKFSYLPLKGPVKLKNPDVTLSYLEFYGVDPNNVPEHPHDLFFGRWVADGQRDLIQVHSLKRRQFIGNTSMDAQLSIIMANQAQVAPGHTVLDPFVGSGSLLVAAAHFGGYVWGSDIDFMMLHARSRPTRVGQKVRTKEESIRGNMESYGTKSKYLDVVVSDFSLPMWRSDLKFDAIITDPPYGVREPIEKIGIERENYTLSEQHLANHIPAKVEYGLPHIYSDLLNFAASHLELGRRIVCWYPLVREEYKEEHLPYHPCLRLVSNSEQVLSKLTARRLLTYKKISEDVPDRTVDPNATEHNFREKYFTVGELTRRERKEKRAKELIANSYWIELSKCKNT